MNKKIMNVFNTTENLGEIRGATISGISKDGVTNSIVKVYVLLDENEIVSEMKFKVFGSLECMALCAVFADESKALSLQECYELEMQPIFEKIELSSRAYKSCEILIKNAITEANNNYEKKKLKEQEKLNKEIVE